MTTSDNNYEWVPVGDAADRLGVSRSTILRMVREGTLVGEKQQKSERDRREHFVIRFSRPQAAPTPAMTAPDAPEPRQAPPAALLSVLADLTATHERLYEAYREIADLRGGKASAESDANHERARADDLAERLKQAEARLALLASELVEAQHTADQRAQALEWVQVQLDRERARCWYKPWTW